MFKNRCWRLMVLAFLLAGVANGLAQKKSEAIDSLFYRGVAVYQEARYDKTIEIMRLLDEMYPDHYRLTASILMQGKAFYQLGRSDEAVNQYDLLIKNYGQSQYVDDAFFGLGQVYFKNGRRIDAVSMFLKVVDIGTDAELQRQAAANASDILEKQLSGQEMETLLSRLKSERSRATVTLKLARREMDVRHYQTAKYHLNNHLEAYPQGQYNDAIRQLRTQAEVLSQGQIKVGVILPLTGPTAEDGKMVLDGLRFAAQKMSGAENFSIQLVIKDSGSDIVQAVKAAQELCADREILAIIGELESSLTTAIAAVAQERQVPLLSPTATLDGIASIGDFVFQLAATYRTHAASIARYAVKDQGLKRFAIFYPADGIGKASRDAFAETVQELGGEIVAETHYFEGASDWKSYIGDQMTALRKAGLERMVEDSLIIFIPKDEWDPVYEEDYGNLHYVNCTMDQLLDSTAVAVTAYDGVFMPVYSDEVIYVAPYFFKQNFDAIPLGGVFWNQENLLVENRDFATQTEGMVFPSPSHYDPDYYQYYQLVSQYRTANRKTPDDLEILAHDIIDMLSKVAAGKSVTRKQIRDGLLEQKRFQGVRGPIVFDETGANEYVHLLRYRNKRILKIK